MIVIKGQKSKMGREMWPVKVSFMSFWREIGIEAIVILSHQDLQLTINDMETYYWL